MFDISDICRPRKAYSSSSPIGFWTTADQWGVNKIQGLILKKDLFTSKKIIWIQWYLSSEAIYGIWVRARRAETRESWNIEFLLDTFGHIIKLSSKIH